MKKINFSKINLSKEIKDFIISHKVMVIGVATVFLLACVSFVISYAYYQVTDKTEIVISRVGEIPDIDIRIMVQNRDANGDALDTYSVAYHVPRTGYTYNDQKSYCANSSTTLNYSADDYNFTIDTTGSELCYAYFNVDPNVTEVIDVYAQDLDDKGEGKKDDKDNNVYSFTTEADLPIVGYELNTSKTKCTNGGTVKYQDGKFSIEGATGKTYCQAYMDAVGVDILITTYIQRTPGVGSTLDDYYKVKKIPTLPTNKHYVLNTDLSECTGTDAKITLEDNKVVVSSVDKTRCVAVLDIENGPSIQSVSLTDKKIEIASSPAGKEIEKWYYSADNGENYTEFSNGDILEAEGDVIIYGTDSEGNESEKVEVKEKDNYAYNGIFTNAGTTEKQAITKAGYYYVRLFATSENSTLGHYIEGYVYLKENDMLYITLGNEPDVTATLRVNGEENGNMLMHQDIENSYIYNAENPNSELLDASYYIINSKSATEETVGNGYAVITYVGQTLE